MFTTPFGTETETNVFAGVAGAQLIQFAPYGYNSQQAASWKCAIPLAAFGVADAAALTNLYLSGVMVSINTNYGNNSYLSGKYLGANIEFPNPEEQPDEYDNISTNYVYLHGLPVAWPPAADETYGVPNSWIAERLPGWTFTADSNKDSDDHPDRAEYFLGTDPNTGDKLAIEEWIGNRIRLHKVGGQMCDYVVETAGQVVGRSWNWQTNQLLFQSTNGEITLPAFTASNLMMRVKIVVPE